MCAIFTRVEIACSWHHWFMRARVLPTTVLPNGERGQGIGLGSNAVSGYHDYAPDNIPGARMESGLDNSPMCAHIWPPIFVQLCGHCRL